MRDVEQKISPLVQSMFPSFYNEEGPNFIAFVKAYYEWLETNSQLLELEDTTNFNVGDKIYQQDVSGTIIAYVGTSILVVVDGFNTFKCYNICSELIPVTSTSGGNTFIVRGGTSRRLSPLYMSRNLTKLRDIDKTLDLFVINFKEKYLKNIEFDTSSNKKLLVKNSLDLYRSKGTERSIDLFFRLVYGIKADVTYPGERLFNLSAGEWYSPTYLEISSASVTRNIELVGKQITGVTSGATAFVEKYIKRKITNGFVHLLYISNIRGEFQKNELIRSDVAYRDSPKVLGSLSSVTVDTGGVLYNIGDVVSFTSSTGEKGLARVSSVRDKNGTIDFELLDGGWGFSVSSSLSPYPETHRTQTLISEKVISLDNVRTGNSVYSISLVNQGSDYNDSNYVNIVSPTVNATARIVTGGGGAITDVVLTNPGSGFFTTTPEIQILDSAGNPVIAGGQATFSLEFNNPKEYFRLLDTVEQNETNTEGTLIYSSQEGFLELSSVNGVIELYDILYQVGNNGESAYAKVTGVVSSSLFSTIVKISELRGTFQSYKPVYVLNKPITGTLNKVNLTVGVSQISNSYSKDSLLYFKYSGTVANVQSFSSGRDANYEVGAIENTQEVYLNTDLVNGNNVLNQAYLSLPLTTFAFGFPKNPAANINDVIFSALEFEPFTLGKILTLSNLNPGEDYSGDPTTLTYQPFLYGKYYRDYIFKIEDLTRAFVPGEYVEQTYTEQRYTIDFASPVSLDVGEKIYASGTPGSFEANGVIVSVNEFSNSIVVGQLTDTISASQNVFSFSNNFTNLDISTVEQFTANVVARAIIEFASDTEVYAKRIQYENLFKYDTSIVGTRSGANATIVSIGENVVNEQIGFNADIKSLADSTEGAVATLKVIDSGFGFQENQQLVFSSNTNTSEGTAFSKTSGIGFGIGYYKTSKGFLSSLSKLHDGDYYQEYSYEVISRIPVDKYASMFKKVMHTAGTRFFGSVLVDSVINSNTYVFSSDIMIMEGSPYVVQDRFSIDVQDRGNIDIEIRE